MAISYLPVQATLHEHKHPSHYLFLTQIDPWKMPPATVDIFVDIDRQTGLVKTVLDVCADEEPVKLDVKKV